MKRSRIIARIFQITFLIIAIAALPLAGLFAYAGSLEAAYTESYYAALPVKYDRLRTAGKEKIVVIGGSSVAFGIDSALMEEELGRPCVNFGLYAAFGLKPMLDLSLGSLEKGDLVVIAPELSSQMFSDYVGYEYLLEALEGRSDMAMALGMDYAAGFVAKLPDYAKNSKKLLSSGGLKVSGVYAASSFDERGDMIYSREKNIMEGGFSPDNLPELTKELLSTSFVNMINTYVKAAEKKGAKVYFGICPVNERSMTDISNEAMEDFLQAIKEKLDCKLIASLQQHILPAGFFYDSNFHMCDDGVIANTVLLINDLKRELGDKTETVAKIPLPKEDKEDSELIAEGSIDGFVYKITASGVSIVGLDEKGLAAKELIVPESIENYKVTKLASGAFKNAAAEKIVLPESVKSLSSELFAAANQLVRVEIHSSILPEVGNSLLNGANSALKLYVPKELYGNYMTDYFWGAFSDRIEELN